MIYEPAEDSFLLARSVREYAKNKKVLDIGSGSGIQALEAKNHGANSVLATDINEESVNLIKERGIEVVQSDLFEKISDKFDLIIFNPPYLPEDRREDKESQLITTGGKKGDEIIIKFLQQAKDYLNARGIILMVLSSLTPKSRIKTLLNKKNLNHEIIGHKNLFMETLEVWKIS